MAITPAAGFVNTTGAFVIGVVGGLGCSQGVKIKDYFNFDDALDAFGIHGIAGIIGGLLLGCLATESIGGHNGLFYGDEKQLGHQVVGIAVTIAWSSIGTALIMLGVDFVLGLRVSATKEVIGLDRSQHASTMYSQLTIVPKRAVVDKRVAGRSNALAFIIGRGRTPTPPTPVQRENQIPSFVGLASQQNHDGVIEMAPSGDTSGSYDTAASDSFEVSENIHLDGDGAAETENTVPSSPVESGDCPPIASVPSALIVEAPTTNDSNHSPEVSATTFCSISLANASGAGAINYEDIPLTEEEVPARVVAVMPTDLPQRNEDEVTL